MDIKSYWKATLNQDEKSMKTFFSETAIIKWPNTNEVFNVDEFILANCKYPGSWEGEIVRIQELGELLITVTIIKSKSDSISLHAISFFKIKNDKIYELEEYFSDDNTPPEWRVELLKNNNN